MSEAINYYLGVDGGGTKTKAVLVSTSKNNSDNETPCHCLLGTGIVAGSNPFSVGWDIAFARLYEAIGIAIEDAGLAATNITIKNAVFAIAGTASREAQERLINWVEQQGFARHNLVVADTAPLLAATRHDEIALGVIAGTGSVVMLQDRQGQTSMVGGWGYLIDDAGSGYAIGRRALREIVRSIDRQEKVDLLTDALMQSLSIESVDDIKQAIYGSENPRNVIASLAETIIRLASRNDTAALRLLEVEANLLANEIAIGWCRLKSGEETPLGFNLYVGGSLLQKSSLYRTMLGDAVKQQGLPMLDIKLAPDGAIGCALLASR